jgi:hypothetical protein
MKKYIYSPHHQGLVLAPLMTEPNKDKFRGIDPGFFEFDHIGYNKEMKAYNTWLSSPPIAKVPDEHKEWFSVERDESEFEVRHQIFSREGKWLDCPKEVYERHSGLLQRETRLVAIPKESKEGSRSLAVLTAEHNKNTLTKILQKKESKEQVDSPIEDRIKELAVDFAFENFPRNGVTYQDVIKLYDEWLSGNGYHQTRLSTPKQITQ